MSRYFIFDDENYILFPKNKKKRKTKNKISSFFYLLSFLLA